MQQHGLPNACAANMWFFFFQLYPEGHIDGRSCVRIACQHVKKLTIYVRRPCREPEPLEFCWRRSAGPRGVHDRPSIGQLSSIQHCSEIYATVRCSCEDNFQRLPACLLATSSHPQTKIARCFQILLTQSQKRRKLQEDSKSCLNSSVQQRKIHNKCRPSSSASIREICLATHESKVLTSTACVKVENRQAVHLAQAARHFVKTTAKTSSPAKLEHPCLDSTAPEHSCSPRH